MQERKRNLQKQRAVVQLAIATLYLKYAVSLGC